MRIDFIIVGQGLCGSWLSYYLLQAGASVLVFDKGTKGAASAAASGIINPITGKRLARQWMSETIAPFAAVAYEQLGNALGKNLARTLPIRSFFSNAEEAAFFEQKAATTHEDLLSYSSHIDAAKHFNYHYGVGTIAPAMLVDVTALLESWRNRLVQKAVLRNADFDWKNLEFTNGAVCYQDLTATAVIDCSGAASSHNPYFNRLPFALNKGEAIIADIPGLPPDAIYKYAQLSIVPWSGGRFWLGSTFDWDFSDALPTAAFRQRVEDVLRQWLRLPVEFGQHFAAIRPATVTRDAFAGRHPLHPRVAILNGMGSKGCSLAPFLAHNLAAHLLHGVELIKEVDVARYARALNR